MSAQHTPGPWSVEKGAKGLWIGADALACRTVAVTTNYCGDEQRLANARLIAAAPELLEAAQDALAGWNYIRAAHGDLYGVGWDRVEKTLSAAITKATGAA